MLFAILLSHPASYLAFRVALTHPSTEMCRQARNAAHRGRFLPPERSTK
jgi:hypothetical protein